MDDKQNVDMNEKQSQLQVEDSSRKSLSHNSELSEKPINMETTKLNATLANPLSGKSHERLMEDGENFARKNGMDELIEEFRKGAVLAQDATAFVSLPMLSKEDKENLRREVEHKWEQPLRLYLLVICCSVAAAVQGVSFR
jgi:aconitase A